MGKGGKMQKLSVAIPAFNENPHITRLLNRVAEIELIDSLQKETTWSARSHGSACS